MNSSSTSEPLWKPGDVAVLRYITRQGAPGMSWPCRVVEDREDLLALFIPRGTLFRQWGLDQSGRRALVEAPWRRDVLRLMFPGASHSVWLFWSDDPQRTFQAYYINMEEPFRRTSIGFDTNDHVLDVVVSPDLSWRWKDEDELQDRVREKIYSVDFAAEVRACAESVVACLANKAPPFGDGWDAWIPPADWAIPELPAGWDTVPAVLWDRRRWAYLDADS